MVQIRLVHLYLQQSDLTSKLEDKLKNKDQPENNIESWFFQCNNFDKYINKTLTDEIIDIDSVDWL